MGKVVLFFTVMSIFLFAAQGKLGIAVVEFEAKGIKKTEADIITDRLRSEMINTGVFRVMERGQMNEVLKEQGFQNSGNCNSSECLVEIGQLLGVERMVVGVAGEIGGMYTLSARMIDVGTGEILLTENEDFRGPIADVLSKAVPVLANKLARGVGAAIQKKEMQGKTGILFLESTPPGAKIKIDGELQSFQTPYTIEGISAGEHQIEMKKDNLYGVRKVNISPDDLLKVKLELQPGRGDLLVLSKPSNALIYVDGVEKGKSPLKLTDLEEGKHRLVLSSQGYSTLDTSVQVLHGEQGRIDLKLQRVASLEIKTAAAGNEISKNSPILPKADEGKQESGWGLQVVRYTALAVGLGGGIATMVFNGTVADKTVKANDIQTNLDRGVLSIEEAVDSYNSEKEAAQNAATLRNVSLAIAGLGFSGFAISFAF